MAIINDPDDLNQGVEVTINPTAKTIALNLAGNLSDDGVTGQALYSFLKEEWRSDNTLIAYDFPQVSITPEQFEFIDDWTPGNEQTRTLIRNAGWREITEAGDIKREYTGIVSLGDIDLADTAYYAFTSDANKIDFDFSGPVNQGIQTFGDLSNGNFDKRGEELSVFIRTQGKLYGLSTTTDIGVSQITYITYRFPLSEADDLKINTTDNDIDTLAPYTGMSITYGAASRVIGGVSYDFDVVIEGNGGTAQEIYNFVQRQLRKPTDIDAGAGTVIGELADELLEFVGDTLKTKQGVYIDNFNAADTNNIIFVDDNGTEVTFPFVSTGRLVFNVNLQNDPSAIFKLFFADTYGTPSAEVVQDNDGNPIEATINGADRLDFTYDYDGNSQGGRTPGTDRPVIAVAIGLETGQYVQASGTIIRAGDQVLSLVSALERNYANP